MLPGPRESDEVGKLYSTHSAEAREDLPTSEFKAEQLFELQPWSPETAITGARQESVCRRHGGAACTRSSPALLICLQK